MTATTKKSTYIKRTKDVAGYVLLPGIIPRVKNFAKSGFWYLAFLIALVYQAVRILPDQHPYCKPSNIGKFGIRHVIGEAANRVKLGWKHLDQIVIFFSILAGIIILFMQFFAVLFMIFTNIAFANSAGLSAQNISLANGIFNTTNPERDVAFEMMDRVFGIPDFFGSQANAEIPTAFHFGLHAIFEMYNTALLIVGSLILLYYIIVLAAETAQSGTPFGRRFKHVYAPLRLVVAVGLLVPLAYGYSGSQYITLWAAKFGSGLATNGWAIYNKELQSALGVSGKNLIAKPAPPSISSIVEFITIVHTCKTAYEELIPSNLQLESDDAGAVEILPYLVKGKKMMPLEMGTQYEEARDFYTGGKAGSVGGDIVIRYGEYAPETHKDSTGGVKPYCGEIVIPVKNRDSDDPQFSNVQAGAGGQPGSIEAIQKSYFNVGKWLFYVNSSEILGARMAKRVVLSNSPKEESRCFESGRLGDTDTCDKNDGIPPSAYKQQLLNMITSILHADVEIATTKLRDGVNFKIKDELLLRGWGGAGIWYNEIAKVNGAFFTSVYSVPAPNSYPLLMQRVQKEKQGSSTNIRPIDRFSTTMPDGSSIKFTDNNLAQIAEALNGTYKYWKKDETTDGQNKTGNVFYDTINALFGTYGLFSIRANNEDNTHPLAQLVGIGKSMLESAIRNLAYSMGFATAGGAATILGGHIGSSLSAVSGFFSSIATIGLTGGFILFYVVPFLPFIYFFFAVGSWVKTIFEAMVGAPLWALAHLRIDQDGLPGKSAIGGYFLILEIFLRPILTVFGLVGGMAIFTAQANMLNELFDIVIENMTGFDDLGYQGNLQGFNADTTVFISEKVGFDRYIIDEFFFTVVYTILIYMMATASFKMIDLVPKSILRWAGASVAAFGDDVQDPTQGLVQYAGIGGVTIGGQLSQGLSKAGSGAGQAIAGAASAAKSN